MDPKLSSCEPARKGRERSAGPHGAAGSADIGLTLKRKLEDAALHQASLDTADTSHARVSQRAQSRRCHDGDRKGRRHLNHDVKRRLSGCARHGRKRLATWRPWGKSTPTVSQRVGPQPCDFAHTWAETQEKRLNEGESLEFRWGGMYQRFQRWECSRVLG